MDDNYDDYDVADYRRFLPARMGVSVPLRMAFPIDKEIDIVLMKELLTDNFVDVFYKNMLNKGYNSIKEIGWSLSSRLWGNSFKETCREFNMLELYTWYTLLKWDESDDFDVFLYGRIMELHP